MEPNTSNLEQNTSDLAARIAARLQTEGIRQKSSWRFRLVEWGWKLLLIATLLLGALAVGLSCEALWPDRSSLHGRGFSQMTLGWLPLLWSLFVGGMMVTGVKLFRHLKYGYRVRPLWVLLLILALVSLLGGLSYQTEATFRTHRFLMHHVGPYRHLFEGQRRQMWVQPGQGRLSGELFPAAPDDSLWRLRDWSGREWNLVVRDSSLAARMRAANWSQVRVVGELCGADFCARQVSNWEAVGGHGGGHGGGKNGHGMGRGMGRDN